MQRGVAIFSFYHRNYSKPSTDYLTHGVLMASIHPAGDSYNHRPSDLHDVCHPTGNFILSSSCVVWRVVRSRGSREKDSEKVSTYAWWYSYLRDCLSLNSQEIVHISLGTECISVSQTLNNFRFRPQKTKNCPYRMPLETFPNKKSTNTKMNQ